MVKVNGTDVDQNRNLREPNAGTSDHYGDTLRYWTALQIRDIKQEDQMHYDQVKAHTFDMKKQL